MWACKRLCLIRGDTGSIGSGEADSRDKDRTFGNISDTEGVNRYDNCRIKDWINRYTLNVTKIGIEDPIMKKRQFFKGRLMNMGGFTMIETIAVLVIFGIVSAVVISRGVGTQDAELVAELNTLKGYLRFAQYRAMNDLPTVQWGIDVAGSSYTLVRVAGGAITTPLSLPGESSPTHSFAPISATAATVLFDDWGSPNVTTIAFGAKTITITPNTGFIP